MSYNLGTASGRIDLSYTGSSAVRRAQTDVGKLQGVMNAAGISAGFLGKAAAIGIGGAVVAGFAVAARSAASFEKRLSAIQAVSGATTSEMESLRRKSLQLGADTAFSANEAASAIEELIKAGLSVEEVMGGAADATVALAAAGEIELAEAATIASNAMNQFNLNAAQLPGVVDAIAGAANASAIDVGDLGRSLTQVGAVANLAGASFDDVATAIALMGNAGIRGSDAGTSLKTMFQNLQPTTLKQIGLFKSLGIVTEDGANRFFDAEGNVKSYAQVAEVLQDSLQGMTRQQKLMALETMFGTDAIRAAAIAADSGAEGVREMNREMSKVTAAEVAATRMDNLAGSFEELTGSIDTALITMGSPLLVALRSIVDGLTGGVNAAVDFGQEISGRVGPGLEDLVGAAENVWQMLTNVYDMVDDLGGGLGDLGLDIVVATFNALASILETVTGALEGQEEAVIIVGVAWMVLANGGIAAVIARLGYFAAWGVVRALDGMMALQAGAGRTTASMAALAGSVARVVASLGAVAAIAGATFAWMAYRDAVNEVDDATRSLDDAIQNGTLQTLKEEYEAIKALNDEYQNVRLDPDMSGVEAGFAAVGKSAKALFTLDFESLGKMMNLEEGLAATEEGMERAKQRMYEMSFATITLGKDMKDINDKEMMRLIEGFQDMDPAALTELQHMMEGYESQLKQVGISQEDIINAWKTGDPADMAGISAALTAIRSDFGRTAIASDAAKGAIEEFGDETKSAAEAADDLKNALDALIGIELSVEEAAISWFEGLHQLREEIGKTDGAIKGNSEEALANRSIIVGQTRTLLDRIDAEARAGASAKRLTGLLRSGRQAIIDNAVAAGVNRKEVEELISTYNLTPKQIRTLVEAAGVETANTKMQELINEYEITPKEVKTIIEAAGATTAAEQVKALRDYINSLQNKSVRIETTHINNVINRVDRELGPITQADGGVHPNGIETYASGGLRNLPAGMYHGRKVMFAEPGTGGEAFIPLAQHKRKRSEMLLGQVASMFGGAFVKYAEGGFNNLADSVASARSFRGNGSDVQVNLSTVTRSETRGGRSRIVEGTLRLDASGRAFIRAVAEEVLDDTEHLDSVVERMN